jgi:hypothetical protein
MRSFEDSHEQPQFRVCSLQCLQAFITTIIGLPSLLRQGRDKVRLWTHEAQLVPHRLMQCYIRSSLK